MQSPRFFDSQLSAFAVWERDDDAFDFAHLAAFFLMESLDGFFLAFFARRPRFSKSCGGQYEHLPVFLQISSQRSPFGIGVTEGYESLDDVSRDRQARFF
jgi:hypothetical protein